MALGFPLPLGLSHQAVPFSGQVNDISYARTSRGLVRSSWDKGISGYLIGMPLQYPEKFFMLYTSILAVKARYSFTFRVKFSLKLRGFTCIVGGPSLVL